MSLLDHPGISGKLTELGGFLFAGFALILFASPTVIAIKRTHAHTVWIFLGNLLILFALSWSTSIAWLWLVLFLWSIVGRTQTERITGVSENKFTRHYLVRSAIHSGRFLAIALVVLVYLWVVFAIYVEVNAFLNSLPWYFQASLFFVGILAFMLAAMVLSGPILWLDKKVERLLDSTEESNFK